MRLFDLIRRHAALCQLLLDLVLMVSVGLYVNRLTSEELWKPLSSGWIFEFLLKAGALNFSLIFFALLVLIRYKLVRNLAVHTKRDLIEKILQAVVKSLVSPNSLEQIQVRSFCHIADRKRKVLKFYANWSNHYNNDTGIDIPYDIPGSDIFVIVKAFKQNRVVVEDLPQDHLRKTPAVVKDRIWDRLKCVLAAPIRDISGRSDEVIGTLCFDSSECISIVNFDSPIAQDVCAICASCIYDLLKE